MFVNISNHPSTKWSKLQLDSAKALGNGEVTDIQFPDVHPMSSTEEVHMMADIIVNQIKPNSIVMVQGEFSLTYAITSKLLAKNIKVVVACTKRQSVEEIDPNTRTVTKTSVFNFCQFRPVT